MRQPLRVPGGLPLGFDVKGIVLLGYFVAVRCRSLTSGRQAHLVRLANPCFPSLSDVGGGAVGIEDPTYWRGVPEGPLPPDFAFLVRPDAKVKIAAITVQAGARALNFKGSQAPNPALFASNPHFLYTLPYTLSYTI